MLIPDIYTRTVLDNKSIPTIQRLAAAQAQALEDIIIRSICQQFQVIRIIRAAFPLSKECKMEYLLLGATFNTVEIQGQICDIMIYKNALTILSFP
jgi:hypothetical protein